MRSRFAWLKKAPDSTPVYRQIDPHIYSGCQNWFFQFKSIGLFIECTDPTCKRKIISNASFWEKLPQFCLSYLLLHTVWLSYASFRHAEPFLTSLSRFFYLVMCSLEFCVVYQGRSLRYRYAPSRTGGRIRRLPSCRVVKPHQWTRLFAVGGES